MLSLIFNILTTLHPPFLHGSLSGISFPPPFNEGVATVEVIGLSDAALVAFIKRSGVVKKSGRSVLTVGSGDRCFV